MIGVLSLPWAWSGAQVALPTAPLLSAQSPSFGPVGTVVTLTGINLTGATLVQLGVASCAFTVVNSTTITATVPVGAVSGAFSVTTPFGTATLAATFTVQSVAVPVPVVASVSPASGPVGTVVTISGSNLSGVSLVTLGLVAVPFTVTAGVITATVPAGASTGAFFVESAAGVGSSRLFTVTQAASVASTRTLRWVLDAFPAVQPAGATRVLLRDSRNALLVRDVVDVETDRYVTPSTVAWALLDGADALVSGVFAVSGDGWRAEVILDPQTQFGAPPVLSITATLAGATWTRDYPITITER